GRAAVALVAGRAGAGDGRDGALGVHLADSAALALADVGVAEAVHADGPRADDDGLRRRAAVADFGAGNLARWLPRPGKRGDRAGLHVHPANPPVPHVGNEQAALAVEHAVVRLTEAGVQRVLAVAGVVFLAVAGVQGDVFLHGVDPADNRVEPVHDVE